MFLIFYGLHALQGLYFTWVGCFIIIEAKMSYIRNKQVFPQILQKARFKTGPSHIFIGFGFSRYFQYTQVKLWQWFQKTTP